MLLLNIVHQLSPGCNYEGQRKRRRWFRPTSQGASRACGPSSVSRIA